MERPRMKWFHRGLMKSVATVLHRCFYHCHNWQENASIICVAPGPNKRRSQNCSEVMGVFARKGFPHLPTAACGLGNISPKTYRVMRPLLSVGRGLVAQDKTQAS